MGRMRADRRLVDIVISTLESLFTNLASKLDFDGDILEYMTASVYGYNDDVVTLYKGNDAASFVKLVYDAQKRGFLFDTSANGPAAPNWRTFMAAAFDKAAEDIQEWIAAQRAAGITKIPAPLVINITDGAPFEGEGIDAMTKARQAAERLKAIQTPDGNVLVFNIHFTTDANGARLILPSKAPIDQYLRFLYDASSVIPEKLFETAREIFQEPGITKESRAMISNENDPRTLLRFITWGTSTGDVIDAGVRLAGIEPAKPRR
ncbi:MAG: hypothetical protein K2F63_05060, partial [Muribaculaceae bacterium]|nr:hypothetical protein [Muribaculaceae bacterium]